MTKAPTSTEKSKTQCDNTKTRAKNFYYTTIADRLRTVSWGNDSHPTGVVQPVYGIPTFPLTTKDCVIKWQSQIIFTLFQHIHRQLHALVQRVRHQISTRMSTPRQHILRHRRLVISQPHVITSTGCSGSECPVPNQHGNIHSTATHVSSNVTSTDTNIAAITSGSYNITWSIP